MTTYDPTTFPAQEYARLKKALVKHRPMILFQMIENLATCEEDKEEIRAYCRSAFFKGLKGDDES